MLLLVLLLLLVTALVLLVTALVLLVVVLVLLSMLWSVRVSESLLQELLLPVAEASAAAAELDPPPLA